MASLPFSKLEECRKLFSCFDTDHDGSISINELGVALRSLGVNPSLKELKESMARFDLDSSGLIDFNSFAALYSQKLKEEITQEDLARYFSVFDRDGDGTISIEELKRLLSSVGEVMTEHELDTVFNDADLDGDGLIDYNEFSAMLLRQHR
jgi:Ca2+-binding EF-hand superfamily protein